MRPIITVTAVVLVHLCVIAVLVGVNGCRSTSGFEQPGDTAAFSGGARPVAPAAAPAAVAPAPAAVPSDRLPTPAPTKLAANGPVGPGGKRTVVKGDTLFSVARSENVAIGALAKANGLPLNAMLKAGQVLTIPSASAPAAPKAAAPKAAPAPAPTFAPLKLVPLTGTAPAPVAAPDKK
ncbi:MAG: LysM peptidoglycan-binding domain-containing protein [Verrucomicrobia bacterium]|nr:LysM peptidoglycan-binding domain-containing protein [Verrucomicrobiota bacterium]